LNKQRLVLTEISYFMRNLKLRLKCY